MKVILHIDFNSYFATVEQQANPRLRGKPVGVTGGDRLKRTVLGAASVEAKRFGVKTGMQIWEARKLCPQIILVPGDSDKYLETTKRFLGILKDYTPYLEVFSIDECFLELYKTRGPASQVSRRASSLAFARCGYAPGPPPGCHPSFCDAEQIALYIKQRIKAEIGEWITCSIGISYNKLMAKLAGSLQKPDGLVVIANQEETMKVLDQIALDEICGIGPRIKKRLNNLGIFDFKTLRKAPLEALLASFKSYGQTLYNMARGIDHSPLIPFYEKGEVKSIGHRHTIDHDTNQEAEIKQILLKLSEMVAARLRAKNLVGKTIHLWYREAFNLASHSSSGNVFFGDGMQNTIHYTHDGLEIFQAAWKIFHLIWPARNATACKAGGNKNKIRMVGLSVSSLKPVLPQNLSLLPETAKQEKIIKTLDKVNDKFGEFTLQRGILLDSTVIRRKPNPFLSERRFKL